MIRLTVYGDFNCPFSALASVRADLLLAGGDYAIDWRAVQHDTAIATAGEPVEGDLATGLADEVAAVSALSDADVRHDNVRLQLVVPPVRSNTAAACAAFAAAGNEADRVRRRLFAAVWAEGSNLGDSGELDRFGAIGRDNVVARRWQDEFRALHRPMTPTLALPHGYVSRGLGALARLADFAATASSSPPGRHT